VSSEAAPSPGPKTWPWSGVVTLSAPVVAVALLGGLIAGGIGAGSVLRQPKRYASRAFTVLDQPAAVFTLGGGEGAITKLNALRAKYGLLIRTPRITAGVTKRTGIPQGAVTGALDVTLPGPTQVMVISATTGDPERSRKIANAAADELAAFVKSEQDAVKVPARDQIVLSVAAQAGPGRQIEPTRSRAGTVGALAGLLGFVAFYLIADAVRARRLRR
jgi:hypothetical protein